ncbi:uncharacterized protein LOC143919142 isoform X3 [Arctopsyche grandis]|uniref:uncharacterized protein LOC143919142 isoform X3 n=1 Tax=Arctopsyche grandis TaxID=121162 RepID=UPI00406D661E
MAPISLPTQFKHTVESVSENEEEVKIYAALTNEECDDWVATSSEPTATRWNIRDTQKNTNNQICRKIYVEEGEDEELNKEIRAALDTVYNNFTSSNLSAELKSSFIKNLHTINRPGGIYDFLQISHLYGLTPV